MRIAVLYTGGFAYYPHLLVKSLLELEENVLVFAPDVQRSQFGKLVGKNENFVYFKKPRTRYPTNLLALYSIIKKIETFKPDVIHLLQHNPWIYIWMKRFAKYPLVLTVHDPKPHLGDYESKKFLLSPDLFYKYASQIIVLGENAKKIVCQNQKVDESMVNVIYHGNYLIYRDLASKSIPKKDNIVLFFGRIYKYKGIEYLIQAEPLISKIIGDVKFVIAGAGDKGYFDRLKKQIINREKFILHNEFVSDDNAIKLFQEASVVVLPYISGTQSGPLLMSYAFKTPVVATNVGSLPEYIDEGKTGFIVASKNPEEIADRITRLLSSKELREFMGLNAFKKSIGELSWEKVGKQTIAVYEKAISVHEDRG